MGKDFFDEDLLPEREPVNRSEEQDGVVVRQISDLNLGRMVRQKHEMASQIAGTASEIEKLRRRQNELEEERSQIQKLSERQSGYETGKKDVLEKLERGMVLLSKQEQDAARLAELLAATRRRFGETLSELREIDEDAWDDDDFEAELNRGLALVENARAVFKTAEARIEAERGPESLAPGVSALVDPVAPARREWPRFGYWLKVGVAVTLPLIAAAIILYVINYYLMGMI